VGVYPPPGVGGSGGGSSVQLTSYLHSLQVGVGVAGGAEAIVHSVMRVVHAHGQEEGHVLALLDFKNAFNSVSRGRMLLQVQEHSPGCSRTFMSIMGGLPTSIWVNLQYQPPQGSTIWWTPGARETL
jgi:hypothetical protein